MSGKKNKSNQEAKKKGSDADSSNTSAPISRRPSNEIADVMRQEFPEEGPSILVNPQEFPVAGQSEILDSHNYKAEDEIKSSADSASGSATETGSAPKFEDVISDVLAQVMNDRDFTKDLVKSVQSVDFSVFNKLEIVLIVKLAVYCCVEAPIGINKAFQFGSFYNGKIIDAFKGYKLLNEQWAGICRIVKPRLPVISQSKMIRRCKGYWPDNGFVGRCRPITSEDLKTDAKPTPL